MATDEIVQSKRTMGNPGLVKGKREHIPQECEAQLKNNNNTLLDMVISEHSS